MKNPTKRELVEALKDFDSIADLLHKKMFIVQPFLALYKKHEKVVLWLDKQKENGTI